MGLVETQKNDAVEKVLAVLRFFALAGVFIFLLNYIATLMNFRHLFGFKITDGFRRSTNYLFLCLGIFIVSRKDPYNYLLKAADEAKRILQHKYFFPVMASVMLLMYWAVIFTDFMAFRLGAWDLGEFDAILENTVNGRMMYDTVQSMNFFGDHFSPILFLTVPLHMLWRSPFMLMIWGPFVLWSSVFILKKLLEEKGHEKWLINLICLMFLNNYMIQNFIGFTLTIYMPLFVLLFWWALRNNKTWLYWTMLLLIFSLKEDTAIYMGGFSLYIFFFEKKRWLAIFTMAASLFWFILTVQYIIPAFAPYGIGHNMVIDYGGWGATPFGIFKGMLSQPLELARRLFAKPYLVLFSTFLFIPLLSVDGILTIAMAWIVTAASFKYWHRNMEYHYGLPLFSFMTVGLLINLDKLVLKLAPRKGITIFLLTAALLMNFGNLKFIKIPFFSGRLHKLLAGIPANSSVKCMNFAYTSIAYSGGKSLINNVTGFNADYLVFRLIDSEWEIDASTSAGLKEKAENYLKNGAYSNMSDIPEYYVLKKIPKPAAYGAKK
jgi:uncharacterized membrane protein